MKEFGCFSVTTNFLSSILTSQLGDDDVGQQKSSIKSGEQNPEYNETFMFTIPTLDNHKLYMSVKDEDVGKDDKLGWCEIKLEDVDGLGEDPVSIEKVVDRNLIKANGMIYIKLSYKE